MKQHRQLLLAAISALAAAGLGACGKASEPATASAPAASAAANVSDLDITEHVMTALNQADSLKGADIRVVTTQGDVRLTGALDNQGQIDEALRIARAAEGSHTIHDELTIKK